MRGHLISLFGLTIPDPRGGIGKRGAGGNFRRSILRRGWRRYIRVETWRAAVRDHGCVLFH